MYGLTYRSIFKSLSAVWILSVTALLFVMTFSGCTWGKELPEDDPVLQEREVNNSIQEEGSHDEEVPEIMEEDPPIGEQEVDADNILFSFTVTGDSRPADDYLPMPGTFLALLELMKDENSSFNISVGDIINGQTTDEDLIQRAFNDYLGAVEGVYKVNFVAPGNHDIINDTTRKYFREMILDKAMADAEAAGIYVYNTGNQDGQNSYYYYFEYNDIYFIILNAFEPGYWGSVKDKQLDWLEAVLEGLKNEVVFVTVHTPPRSFINPDTITDGSVQVGFSDRQNLEYVRGLFKDHMVDAVFSGHEHVYSKELHDGTHYMITALSGEYPYFPEEEGGFYHYVRVDIKAGSWVFNVIGIEGDLRYQEEIVFN